MHPWNQEVEAFLKRVCTDRPKAVQTFMSLSREEKKTFASYTDKASTTILHQLSRDGDDAFMKEVISHSNNIDHRNALDMSPLDVAAQYDNLEAARVILSHLQSSEIDICFFSKTSYGDRKSIRFARCDKRCRTCKHQNNPPLIYAIKNGLTRCTKFFVKQTLSHLSLGSKVTRCNESGCDNSGCNEPGNNVSASKVSESNAVKYAENNGLDRILYLGEGFQGVCSVCRKYYKSTKYLECLTSRFMRCALMTEDLQLIAYLFQKTFMRIGELRIELKKLTSGCKVCTVSRQERSKLRNSLDAVVGSMFNSAVKKCYDECRENQKYSPTYSMGVEYAIALAKTLLRTLKEIQLTKKYPEQPSFGCFTLKYCLVTGWCTPEIYLKSGRVVEIFAGWDFDRTFCSDIISPMMKEARNRSLVSILREVVLCPRPTPDHIEFLICLVMCAGLDIYEVLFVTEGYGGTIFEKFMEYARYQSVEKEYQEARKRVIELFRLYSCCSPTSSSSLEMKSRGLVEEKAILTRIAESSPKDFVLELVNDMYTFHQRVTLFDILYAAYSPDIVAVRLRNIQSSLDV